MVRGFVPSAGLIINTAIIIVATLFIYGQDLLLIFSKALVLSSGNIGNYILVIPFLSAFVLYRKRQVLRVVASSEEGGTKWLSAGIGISLSSLAIMLFIYGSSTLNAIDYHIYSMPLFVAGATALLFNLKTLRHAFFAIVLLFFLQPPSGELIGQVAADLSWISAITLNALLHFVGIDIELEASFGAPTLIIERPDGIRNTFAIGEPSSGVYSTIGMIVFSLFIAYIATGRIWKRLVILAVSLPLFFTLNIIRIGTIIGIWYVSDEVAAEAFHAVGGILMVTIGTLLLLVVGEKLLGIVIFGRRQTRSPCALCSQSLKKGESFCLYCGRVFRPPKSRVGLRTMNGIFIIIALSALIVFVQPQVNLAYAAKGIEKLDITSLEGPETTQYMLPPVEGYERLFAYRDKSTENLLRQDLSVAYVYKADTNRPNPSAAAAASNGQPIVFVGMQISTGKHTWEDSVLIHPSRVGRPTADVIELKNIGIPEGQEFRFFVYQNPDSKAREAVLYWFERLPFNFGDHFEPRNLGIIIWSPVDSLIQKGIIAGQDDINGIERYFLTFAEPIAEHWREIRSQIVQTTLLDNIITKNASTFMILSLLPAIIIGVVHNIRNNRLKDQNKRIINQLAIEEERVLLNSLSENPQGQIGMEIAQKYNFKQQQEQQHTMNVGDLSGLGNLLTKAKDAGFLRNDTISIKDEPIVVWKSIANSWASYFKSFWRTR
jgi:exosortase